MKIVLAALVLSAGCAVASAQTDVQLARAGTNGLLYDISSAVFIGVDTVGSSSWAGVWIRDTTASMGAINIFMPQGDFDALGLQLGDLVSITLGEKDSFNGLSELVFPSPMMKIGSGGNFAPISVSATDFANGSGTAEGLESQRVSISSVFADAGDVGAAWAYGNYSFTDGGGNIFTARISTDAIADRMNANYGNIGAGALDLVGIFGQYDNSGNPVLDAGYQLLLAPSPSSVALLGLGGLFASRRRRS